MSEQGPGSAGPPARDPRKNTGPTRQEPRRGGFSSAQPFLVCLRAHLGLLVPAHGSEPPGAAGPLLLVIWAHFSDSTENGPSFRGPAPRISHLDRESRRQHPSTDPSSETKQPSNAKQVCSSLDLSFLLPMSPLGHARNKVQKDDCKSTHTMTHEFDTATLGAELSPERTEPHASHPSKETQKWGPRTLRTSGSAAGTPGPVSPGNSPTPCLLVSVLRE